MFSKENICFSLFLLVVLLLSDLSCAVPPPEISKQVSPDKDTTFSNSFALPQQKVPPKSIKSIQLYAGSNPTNPPIINLEDRDKLTLSFDFLDHQNKQFQIEISHHSQTWTKSNISPTVYLDSFSKTYIQYSQQSLSQRLSYQHIEYKFPNDQLNPTKSGNYLLEVYSYDGNEMLFSIPFFITENQGNLNTRIKTLHVQREDGRAVDQLFSTYQYPSFVEFPQFDLSLSYIQNRFWGRMRQVKNLDTITPGELNAHMDREGAFISDYGFRLLDLRTFSVDKNNIIDYHPGNPPQVTLRRDVQNLERSADFSIGSLVGQPENSRSGKYAQVMFHLETGDNISQSAEIYLVGDFNNWMINPINKMDYDANTNSWKGQSLIKQGQYTYTYVLLKDNHLDNLSLDTSFISSQQEYLTLIYFNDPTYNFDRLLKVEHTVKD